MKFKEESRGKKTVLLIDDDPQIRDLLQIVLRGSGYRVRVAKEAHDVLPILEDPGENIDLLLVDLFLPGVSGLDLADEVIREQPETKVLYISGLCDSEEIRSRAPGQWGKDASFINKPFRPTALVESVDELLGC
jgi:two-component system, cell cycle sensor histidine kinase and response regulator CckA